MATDASGALVALDGSNSPAEFTEYSWWENCSAAPCAGAVRLTADSQSSLAEVQLSVGEHSVTLMGRSDTLDWTVSAPIVVIVRAQEPALEGDPIQEPDTGIESNPDQTETDRVETASETESETVSLASIPACDSLTTLLTTSLNTWNMTETRATGHNELVPGGLHVWTEGATSTDKAAGYYLTDFPLTEAGVPEIQFASFTGGRPSVQLRLDVTGDGIWEGTLVYEPWAYGDGMYWSSYDFGVGAGAGYASFGTLNQYLAVHPAARVVQIGYSLGSGVLGEAVITSITAGCVSYTFDVPPPRPRIHVAPNTVTPGQNTTVSLTDFDPNDSVRIRWRVGASWIQVGTVSTDANGAGSSVVTVPTDATAGANSVRGDGASKAQQTNAVTVVVPGPAAVVLSTGRATVNSTITFTASNFPPSSEIAFSWRRPGGSIVNLGTVMADSGGDAAGSFKVPASEAGSLNTITFTAGAATVTLSFDVAPRIKVTPASVTAGDTVNVSLRGYGKGETVRIRWLVDGSWVTVATVTTSNTGSANIDVVVPANANVGQNSVRGDGPIARQQTNAVTVVP